MINKDDYGWFVRIAFHPISIRTLNRDKVKVYHRQVVFHQKKYIGKMPGFSPVLGFNPQDPAQRELIRVGPPPEFQSLEISNYLSDAELNAPEEETPEETPEFTTDIVISQEQGLHTPVETPTPVQVPAAPVEVNGEVVDITTEGDIEVTVSETSNVSLNTVNTSQSLDNPISNDDVLNELNDIELSQVLAKARQLVVEEREQKKAAEEAAAKKVAEEEAAKAAKAKADAEAAAKVKAEKEAQATAARKAAEEKRARQEAQKKAQEAKMAEKKAKLKEAQEKARLEAEAKSAAEAKSEEVTEKPANNHLNTLKEELADYDNRKWYALTKKEACKFLDDAGIDHSHIDDTKWDKVNFLKEQVQDK